jgi:hypothetical protein
MQPDDFKLDTNGLTSSIFMHAVPNGEGALRRIELNMDTFAGIFPANVNVDALCKEYNKLPFYTSDILDFTDPDEVTAFAELSTSKRSERDQSRRIPSTYVHLLAPHTRVCTPSRSSHLRILFSLFKLFSMLSASFYFFLFVSMRSYFPCGFVFFAMTLCQI